MRTSGRLILSRLSLGFTAASLQLLFGGCAELTGVVKKEAQTAGGAETVFVGPRQVNPADVALPPGYRIEAVSTGFTFPTAVVFDDRNRPHVVESGYAYGERYAPGRLLRVEPDGSHTVIAQGANQPWTGGTFYRGAFYVAQGGYPGKIVRITPDGQQSIVVDGIPSKGDHHTNGPVIGPDGWLYFAQGAITNSGVVGEDNALFGWLLTRPQLHDIPGRDIVLAGQNFKTGPIIPPLPVKTTTTGAFVPLGTPTTPGQVIKGQLPATAAVMRVRPEGGQLELVAWGIRNAFGLAFSPDGRLFATDTSYDNRGSRPIENAPDMLWHVRRGVWYGFPDYNAGVPLTDPRFRPEGKPQPQFLLAEHPNKPPKPTATFAPHSASHGLDFSRSGRFGYAGQAFVAQMGDITPPTGVVQTPPGYKVVRVDPRSGSVTDFAANKAAQAGPASKVGGGGLERPLDVQFDRTGNAMYVVDFGVITTPLIPNPRRRTGVLWRITREG
jgi:glucose/arabinose dehydrogenase